MNPMIATGMVFPNISSTGRSGVTIGDLQKWNNIRDAGSIRVGQTLTLRVVDRSWTIHTVRAGESLSVIAGRNGCTVRDLIAWNELPSHVIQPGQKLKIKRQGS